MAGLARVLAADRVAFLAPSAPGGVWYPQRFFVPLDQNEPWLSRALNEVDAVVRQAHDSGIPLERIGLVGFSQGACLALEYAARNPRRYGFVAGLSGALIGPLAAPRAIVDLQKTPVLLGCAESDAHIPLPHLEESARLLAGFGASVTKQVFPGGDHTVFPKEIEWLRGQSGGWGRDA